MPKLELLNPENATTPDKEVIRIKVLGDTNLKLYAIVDKTFDADGKETDTFKHIYSFPDWPVKAGDYIRLYSGTGDNHTTPAKDKKARTHQLYWNSKVCIWNDKGDTASLIRYKTISKIEVPPVAKN